MSIYDGDHGTLSGSSGKSTYRLLKNNKNVHSRKIKKTTNRNTDKQRFQRSKWKTVSGLLEAFKDVYRVGFAPERDKISVSNNFMKHNLDNVEVDEKFAGKMDFMNLVCSYGKLDEPEVAVSIKDNTARVVQTSQLEDYSAHKDDEVYLVFYNKLLNRVNMMKLLQRGQSGTTSHSLKKKWKAEDVICYAFAVSAN